MDYLEMAVGYRRRAEMYRQYTWQTAPAPFLCFVCHSGHKGKRVLVQPTNPLMRRRYLHPAGRPVYAFRPCATSYATGFCEACGPDAETLYQQMRATLLHDAETYERVAQELAERRKS